MARGCHSAARSPGASLFSAVVDKGVYFKGAGDWKLVLQEVTCLNTIVPKEVDPFSIENGLNSFSIHTFRNQNVSSEWPKSVGISRLPLQAAGGEGGSNVKLSDGHKF